MVYNYTKPRAPIAAMYSSPGPCYGLPSLVGHPDHDPRSVHSRAPAYQFGTTHSRKDRGIGPGPQKYYPESKLYRDGRDGSPHYSLYARRREVMPFSTPAPGAYTPDRAKTHTGHTQPSYSFGVSYASKKSDQTPAPNAYKPPPLIGRTLVSDKRQAPSYSVYGRSKTGSFHEDYQKTPGPGSYKATNPNEYKHRQPHYSLTGRNLAPGDTTQKPGPGAHKPELVKIHSRQTPSYSFGIRHSDYVAPLIAQTDFD